MSPSGASSSNTTRIVLESACRRLSDSHPSRHHLSHTTSPHFLCPTLCYATLCSALLWTATYSSFQPLTDPIESVRSLHTVTSQSALTATLIDIRCMVQILQRIIRTRSPLIVPGRSPGPLIGTGMLIVVQGLKSTAPRCTSLSVLGRCRCATRSGPRSRSLPS